MNTNRILLKSTFIPIMLLVFVCINACAELRLGTIPSLPPSAKLRVFILPVTGNAPRPGWARPHEQFKKDAFRGITSFLQDTGIYEVVPEEDIRAVLGKQDVEHWKWLRNDLALVKQAGKALHADYAIIFIRNSVSGWDYESRIICVNLGSGKQYTNSFFVPLSSMTSKEQVISDHRKMFQAYYQKMFHDVKEDLLATAFRKGRLLPMEETKEPAAPKAELALAQPSGSPIAPILPGVATEKKPPSTGKALPKLIPPVSKPPEEEKLSALKPSKEPMLKTPLIPEPLPVSKPPAAEAKHALPKGPLKPMPPPEVSIPKTVIPVTQADQGSKTTVSDSKEDSASPQIVAKTFSAPPPDLSGGDKHKDFERKLKNALQGETPVTDKTRLVVYDFAAIERLNVVALILTEALREELFTLGRFRLVNREDMMQMLQEHKLQQSGLVDEKQVAQLGKWLAANESVTGRLAVLGNTYVLQAKRTDIQTLGTLGLGSLRCVAGHEDELLSGIAGLARRLVGLHTTPHGNK
jgi:hypothetical protein